VRDTSQQREDVAGCDGVVYVAEQIDGLLQLVERIRKASISRTMPESSCTIASGR
jgi:hypothetical protein